MQLLCPDSSPTLWGIFDPSIAPPLLFYSYIPVIVISTLLGFYVLYKDRFSLSSKLLFLIELFFSLWSLNIFMMWIAAYSYDVMFSWQINAIFEVPIFIFSVYFLHVFTHKEKKDVPDRTKLVFILSSLPFAIFLATPLNIPNFDIASCEGINGHLWDYMYILEIASIAWIGNIGLSRYRAAPKNASDERKEVVYTTTGVLAFLILFMASNFLGEITGVQEISFAGSFGMLLFLGFLTYLIVRYRVFNIKMLATQALMIALVALTGSQLLYVRNPINRVLTLITLAMTTIFGALLIRSVEREVAQREKIQKLAVSLADTNKELAIANDKLKELDKQKTEFVSLASHQLRSPLTAIKGYSSMILEGSFGQIGDKAKEAVARVYESSQKLVLVIEDFLNITRIELGRMKYEMGDFNLNQLVQNVIGEQKPNVIRRGLEISYEEDASGYLVNGDLGKLSQVISNLIDNAVKYTKEGGIKVRVASVADGKSPNSASGTGKKKKKVRLSVQDTGVGIEAKTMPHLFEKFVRAHDAGQTNQIGTGLGLYVAKQIMDAHKGKIWAESAGKGKGSTFFVELATVSTLPAPAQDPAVKTSVDTAVHEPTKQA